MYSSVLETVRNRLVDCIPSITDEMISRAIIHAFADSNVDRRQQLYSTTNDSWGSYNEDGDDSERIHDDLYYNDKYQIKVNLLWKAYEYAQDHRHSNQRDQRNNHQSKAKLEEFLQSILNDVFFKIRREDLTSSNDIVRMMISVMSILQIPIRTTSSSDDGGVTSIHDVPNDTILLYGLPNHTTRNELQQQLSIFGEIQSVATATASGEKNQSCNSREGFAYCCFVHEDSVRRIMDQQQTIVLFDHVHPTISCLHGNHTSTTTTTLHKEQTAPTAIDEQPDEIMSCLLSGRLLYSI
jgi:hypothetical protein